jgi:hypothetical protein
MKCDILDRWDRNIFMRSPHAEAPCLCDLAPQQTLERQLIRTCMVNAEALRLIRGLGFESQFLSARTEKTVWWWLCTPPPLRPRGMFEHDELHGGARDEIEVFRKEVTTALMIGSYLMRVVAAPHPMIERIYTRDAMVPLVEGDNEFHFGWQCIPQLPNSDPGWEIFDSSKDCKTGWQRITVRES